MSEDPTQIELGGKTYKLVPQRIGRIQRKLSQVMELFSGRADVTEVGPRLYDALQVFIPDLDPIWKLQGYPTPEAAAKVAAWEEDEAAARKEHSRQWLEGLDDEQREKIGEPPPFEYLPLDVQAKYEATPKPEDVYSDDADSSPTPPEIIDAIEAIFKLHGGERLAKLVGKFVSEETIRQAIDRQVIIYQSQQAWERSQSLRLGNGASASTPSTTPALTAPANPSDSLPSD